MVMSFFRKSESGLDNIAHQTISMLGDARHSFDMATTAVLSGGDPELVSADILDTDSRINEAEQELRSELVVHVSVQGTSDIGTVLSYTLLIKKIERIGDQAKNILDLAFEGVSFADAPDAAELSEHRQAISELFGRVSDAMSEPDEGAVEALLERATELRREYETEIRSYMHSTEPAPYAVPRAIFYRYLKRIVANLAGILTSATEPLQHQDYLDDGTTDIDDD